jgi:predicted amidohydrolase
VTTSLRAGALQLRAHDRAAFIHRSNEILESVRAAALDLDLLVVPESTFPAYVLGDASIDDAAVEAAVARLQSIARERACVIVAGAAVRRGRSLFNSALVIDRDGSIAGAADKLFLWHFDRKWFAPGERLAPIPTSIGAIGALVCADGRIPTIARALVDRGAEILAMPTAWVTSGRDPGSLENLQADLLGRVRAYENGVPFIAANKCGTERGMVAYCGKSQIVAADGSILALASEGDEETIRATFELAEPRPKRVERPSVAPRGGVEAAVVRVAMSLGDLPADIDERLALLDAQIAVSPASPLGLAQLDRILPSASLDAAVAEDPGALVAYRAAGYRCFALVSDAERPWLERIARARAAELRAYVLVFDRHGGRAYAVDPDGAIVAGTFGGYTLASFPIDTARTNVTTVAPGTDVADGLERIGALARKEARA